MNSALPADKRPLAETGVEDSRVVAMAWVGRRFSLSLFARAEKGRHLGVMRARVMVLGFQRCWRTFARSKFCASVLVCVTEVGVTTLHDQGKHKQLRVASKAVSVPFQ